MRAGYRVRDSLCRVMSPFDSSHACFRNILQSSIAREEESARVYLAGSSQHNMIVELPCFQTTTKHSHSSPCSKAHRTPVTANKCAAPPHICRSAQGIKHAALQSGSTHAYVRRQRVRCKTAQRSAALLYPSLVRTHSYYERTSLARQSQSLVLYAL